MRHCIAAFGIILSLQGAALGGLRERSFGQFPTAAPIRVTPRIDIIVPHDEAELLIDGTAVPGTGIFRTFDTAPLESGKTYDFTMTVTWRPNNYTVITRTRTFRFVAGREMTADLTGDDSSDHIVIRYSPDAGPNRERNDQASCGPRRRRGVTNRDAATRVSRSRP